jgi:hypothetical protein
MSKADDFLDLSADIHADIDEIVEKRSSKFRDRVSELLFNPKERSDYWVSVLEPQELASVSLQELLDVPIAKRSLLWSANASQILSICQLQAYSELMGDQFETFGQKSSNINKFAETMSKDDLREASSRRDMKSRVDKVKQKKILKEE